MARAIDMRLERHSVLVELTQVAQTPHLEAATIGQNRTVPVHERVQPAELFDQRGTGPQHQVIGIGENDLRARRVQLFR